MLIVMYLKSPMNWHEIKEIFLFIWPNTWRDGLVSMSNYVTSQGMSLMAGAFLPSVRDGCLFGRVSNLRLQ